MGEQRTIIVTGASRGLGAAVARCLGQAGASLTLAARSEQALHAPPAWSGRFVEYDDPEVTAGVLATFGPFQGR